MNEWLEKFYNDPDLRDTMLRSFLPLFSEYVAEATGGPVAGTFVQALAESYVDRHLGSSRAQLQDLVSGSSDPLKDLAKRFEEWEEKRPEKVAKNELIRSANAAQVQSFRDAGVEKMIWRSSGGACPFCQELDGVIISVNGTFFEPGDTLNPEGVEHPINFESTIGHPPVHQGCTCSVEAVTESEVPINQESVAKVDDHNAEHWQRDYELWAEYTKEVQGLAELPSFSDFQNVMTDNAKAIVDGSSIRIRTGRESLASILEDGRFKSQFETSKSGGILNPKLRAEVEEFYFGIGAKAGPTTRPIYGYLGGDGDLKRISQYGDIVVELKDEVRTRSTVTFYDSLDAYKTNEAIGVDGPSLTPRPMSNVDWRAWKPWDPDQAYGDATSINTARSVPGYPEVQVHGGVTTSDIKEVVFTRSQPSPEITSALDAAGVPWRYDGSFVNEGF